jgi:hypothetical protein
MIIVDYCNKYEYNLMKHNHKNNIYRENTYFAVSIFNDMKHRLMRQNILPLNIISYYTLFVIK